MSHTNVHDLPYAVIGAGPSGLAVLHRLRELKVPCSAFEQLDDVGGNWYYGTPHSSVAASTHLISSKRLTEFPDFRMPGDYPPYPSHAQALTYLRDYARHYRLYDAIQFGAKVAGVERSEGQWHVITTTGARQAFRGVIVANGHHWDPYIPAWASDFTGSLMHAHDYTTPEPLQGQRVLVVGAGNSGCDIAVESAVRAADTVLSMRRGYYFLPKFLCGAPLDRCGDQFQKWPLPRAIRDRVARALLYVAVGPPTKYGLPQPDHRLFETHPIVNSQLPYYVGHGRVRVACDVASAAGRTIHFVDGSSETFDLVVLATGYRVSFPFLSREVWQGDSSLGELFLRVFAPREADLFFAGLFQPNGGIWPLSDLQGQLIARLLLARRQGNAIATAFDQRRVAGQPTSPSRNYVDSPRHRLEVDYHEYGRSLRGWIKQFDRGLGTGSVASS